MKKYLFTVFYPYIVVSLLFNINVLACTGFVSSNDDLVLVGNNEDIS
ncbi:unnamed protein product, partial [marine sediment metagenome]